MADWRKAPPLKPDPQPTRSWWFDYATQADWEGWKRAREAETPRMRHISSRYDPNERTPDSFHEKRFKRKDNR